MRIFLLLLFFGGSISLSAQTDSLDQAPEEDIYISSLPDSAFLQARNFAYDRDFEKARVILDFLVRNYPDNPDYSLFNLRTFIWDKQYDSARVLVQGILDKDSMQLTARELQAQIERYDGRYGRAIKLSEAGIRDFEEDEFFVVNKVQSLTENNQYRRALAYIDTAEKSYPSNKEISQVKTFLLNQFIADGVAIGGQLDYFTSDIRPWFGAFGQVGRMTENGVIVGRVNFGRRQLRNGYQFEVDAYPRISKRRYFYLNAGYSPSSLFPLVRFGAEYFSMFGESSWEWSAGLRYLDFRSNQVRMYTGTLGKYWGNHYLNFRPFFINDRVGWGSSYNLLYRRFFSGQGDYFQLTAGAGAVPNQRIIEISSGLGLQTFNLSNQYLGLAYQRLVDEQYYARFELTFTRQENFAQPDDFLTLISLGLVIGYRF